MRDSVRRRESASWAARSAIEGCDGGATGAMAEQGEMERERLMEESVWLESTEEEREALKEKFWSNMMMIIVAEGRTSSLIEVEIDVGWWSEVEVLLVGCSSERP